MPLEKALVSAAGLTWRQRGWWVLGLLATVGGMLVGLASRAFTWYAAGRMSPGGTLLTDVDVEDFLQRASEPGRLVGGVTVALLLGLVLWLLGAVAEGGLIVAVAGRGRNLGPSRALSAGAGLLGRFIGIDTLLFLPLFLLSVTLLLAAFGGLVALVVAATGEAAEFKDLLLVAGLAAAVSLPLLALLLVIWPVTMIMRALAFRAAAVEGLAVRQSIGRAWRLLRREPLAVVVLTLVLAGLRWLAGMPLRFVSLLLIALGWGQVALQLSSASPGSAAAGLLLGIGGLILALVSWLVSGIMNAFTSAAWTLSYESWAGGLD